MAMAGIAFTRGGVGYRPARPARPGPRGVIKPGKSFNHFPAIIAAFPDAVSEIVIETTEALGELSQQLAPVQADPRPTDPTPGTLKASKTTSFKASASDIVVTGRVTYGAKDRYGHRYAKPLETGSIRRTKRGLRKVAARPFLVDAIVVERAAFLGKLSNLESRLPK